MDGEISKLIVNSVKEDSVILLNYLLNELATLDAEETKSLYNYAIFCNSVNTSIYLNNYIKEKTLNLTK